MNKICTGIVLSALLAAPLAAQAQFAKVEDAIKYRQSAFSLTSTHMGRIGAVVKGERAYDKAQVEADAAIVEILSKLPWTAFPNGSTAANSKAKPNIWTEQDKFNAAAEKFQAAAVNLSAAARSGDQAQLRTAFGAVGQSCKACHDNYRSR